MQSLRQALSEAEKRNIAIGHFNTSDLTALRAIVDAARELKLPVLVGVSEGEREIHRHPHRRGNRPQSPR
jgi:fructose-bisphosphate aldolase class II